MKRIACLLALLPALCQAQVKPVYDSLLTGADSLSIFQLIDSLITALDEEEETSQLAIRTGYNSNINGLGNAFQLSEYGLSASAAFYHKSGLYADVSGYWCNEYTPQYYQTMISAGYMLSSLKAFSVNLEYRKAIYHIDGDLSPFPRIPSTFISNFSSGIYTNSLTSTLYFEYKTINLRADYTLLMEPGTILSTRISPTASLNFEKRHWLKTEKISVFPSISWLFGSEVIPTYVRLFNTRLEALLRIRNGLPLFGQIDDRQWGSLNFSASLPVAVSWKNWALMASYTYNWPGALPNSIYQLEDGGYFAFSATRYINFKSRRKS